MKGIVIRGWLVIAEGGYSIEQPGKTALNMNAKQSCEGSTFKRETSALHGLKTVCSFVSYKAQGLDVTFEELSMLGSVPSFCVHNVSQDFLVHQICILAAFS